MYITPLLRHHLLGLDLAGHGVVYAIQANRSAAGGAVEEEVVESMQNYNLAPCIYPYLVYLIIVIVYVITTS